MENKEHDILNSYYTVKDGFGFTAVTYPFNIYDGIIIKCPGLSHCESPQYDVPERNIEEYIKYINTHKTQKAVIILNDISFITDCPSLKYLHVIPSYEASSSFDFSPLYHLPEIKSLCCDNKYGLTEQYTSTIDYARISGLMDLGISINSKTLNYNKVDSLKSLGVSQFKGIKRDLTDLFCSRQLDTLSMIQCGIQSLNGIEISDKMQCLYLSYIRSLQDISALEKVKSTLKALRIENCPKIEDFSVLSELENLELLELSGNNCLPNLNFLNQMKKLKIFIFSMNVLDGNLFPCMNISRVCSGRNRKHYNLKDQDLPKGKFTLDNSNIEEWRRME